MALTPKQEAFCQVYIKTGNATEAYRAAYDCARMKDTTVSRNAKFQLDNNKIATRLQILQAEYIKANELSPEKVLKEWMKIGFADVRELLTESGRMKPVSEWPDSISGAVASIEVRQDPGDIPADIIKLKIWPKTAALDALSKNLGLFEKDNEQKGKSLADALRAAGVAQ